MERRALSRYRLLGWHPINGCTDQKTVLVYEDQNKVMICTEGKPNVEYKPEKDRITFLLNSTNFIRETPILHIGSQGFYGMTGFIVNTDEATGGILKNEDARIVVWSELVNKTLIMAIMGEETETGYGYLMFKETNNGWVQDQNIFGEEPIETIEVAGEYINVARKSGMKSYYSDGTIRG